MYSVFVEDLEFYGHHGVSQEERAVGHRFSACVQVVIDSEPPTSDRVEDTVDYSRLAGLVVDVGTGKSYLTVEALAANMCDLILKTFPLVKDAHIDLSKIAPPFPHIAKSAGVRVSASRDEVTQ